MNKFAASALIASLVAGAPAFAMLKKGVTPNTIGGELNLYELKNFNGDDYMINSDRSLVKLDWNVGSIAVHPGDKWQVCAKPRFKEPCMVIDQSVADASVIGIEGGIGSVRELTK